MIPYKNNSTATHLVLFIAILFILSCTKDKNLQSLSQAEQSSLSTGRGTKPNIILIMGDDIGKEIPTYNGGESYQTPNLDFMAAAGLQFPKFTAHPDG